MVFDFATPNPLGIHLAEPKDHAYLNCYPACRGPPGRKAPTTQGQQKF